MNTFDVLIIGGGPVGLWLGCELKLAGLNVAVVERRKGRIDQSRALTIHGRTLEMFGLRGLADRFMAQGKPVPTGHYAMLDTRLDFSFFDSPFPHSLFIPQKTTEEIIEARAHELGVVHKAGHEVDALGQDAESIFVEGTSDKGRFRLVGRYLVGCDGARSVTRRLLNIGFPGLDPTHAWLMGDVEVDLPEGKLMLSEFNGNGSAMIAPLGDGVRSRIIVATPDEADLAVLKVTPTLSDLTRMTKKVLGTDFNARDPIWISRFTNETRLADRYRSERAFLAGDAAHIHLPAGGQGMNVGLQDAFNLGWKLAAVVKGEASEALLATYDQERRPIGKLLHDNTLAQGALLAAFSPAGLALRSEISTFLSDPALNKKVAGQVSGFSIDHANSPILSLFTDEPNPGNVGKRVPDLKVRLAAGGEASIHALLSDGRWLHVSFQEGARVPLADRVPEVAFCHVPVKEGPDGFFANMAALLIRPDGFSFGSI